VVNYSFFDPKFIGCAALSAPSFRSFCVIHPKVRVAYLFDCHCDELRRASSGRTRSPLTPSGALKSVGCAEGRRDSRRGKGQPLFGDTAPHCVRCSAGEQSAFRSFCVTHPKVRAAFQSPVFSCILHQRYSARHSSFNRSFTLKTLSSPPRSPTTPSAERPG
jgi:hypothetical protein